MKPVFIPQYRHKLKNKFFLKNKLSREVLCEFCCTWFLMFTGTGISLSETLKGGNGTTYLAGNVGWVLVAGMAIHMGFNITGSHMNPAFSFNSYLMNLLTFKAFIFYSIAQIFGAFLGSLCAYYAFIDAINKYDGGYRQLYGDKATAHLFATFPAPHLSFSGSIIDQFLASFILAVCVGIITDINNQIPKWAQPFMISTVIGIVGGSLGINASNAMNPARDLGPRILLLLEGYGWEVFSFNHYSWFWVPIVIPMIGVPIGTWVYNILISFQIEDELYCHDLQSEYQNFYLTKINDNLNNLKSNYITKDELIFYVKNSDMINRNKLTY
uniref:Aquaporin-9 n=1 Tax=Parastrongyloides trichosuri TaxID=131310 RepID=A0A0N4ZST9_PARTI